MQTLLLSLMTDPNRIEANAAIPTSPEPFWTVGSIALCAIGLSVLISWRLWYGGFDSLRDAPIRRNRLSPFWPIILLGIWIFLMAAISEGIAKIFKNSPETFQDALSYPAMVVLETGLIAAMLVMAYRTFARRLKGFGLNVRTIAKDAGWAMVYLLAVYPLILLALWMVLTLGRFVKGDFNIQTHQSLTFLAENGNPALRMLTIFFAVVIVPVFEEILFRGFLQTAIRSLTGRAWAAIFLTSVFFSILHPITHAPALFFLSCGLGYGYERSGSLFRSILMHVFFNGVNVAVTLWLSA